MGEQSDQVGGMTTALAPKECPSCGAVLAVAEGPPKRAKKFDDCLRRCVPCGVAWSNGASDPVSIWKDPLHNVPGAVRPGLLDAISQALNERNRPSKLDCLGSASSEDAVTWTVFQYLAHHSGTDAPWRLLSRIAPEQQLPPPTLLLWGVPISGAAGAAVRGAIVDVSNALGEVPASRTEPDVVLDLGAAGVVVVEVKYRSGNDDQDDKPWRRYVGDPTAFADQEAVQASGRYELARNWRLGCDLARDRPLTLVNLVARPERGAELARTNAFAASLSVGARRQFLRLTFAELLSQAGSPWPDWFSAYVERHGLATVP